MSREAGQEVRGGPLRAADCDLPPLEARWGEGETRRVTEEEDWPDDCEKEQPNKESRSSNPLWLGSSLTADKGRERSG